MEVKQKERMKTREGTHRSPPSPPRLFCWPEMRRAKALVPAVPAKSARETAKSFSPVPRRSTWDEACRARSEEEARTEGVTTPSTVDTCGGRAHRERLSNRRERKAKRRQQMG